VHRAANHRHDRGVAEIRFEDVALDERDARLHAFGFSEAARVPHEIGVVLDADGRGAEQLRGRDRQLAVTRAQVVHLVGGRDLRELEQRPDHAVFGRLPDDVFAFLRALRRVLAQTVGARCRVGRRREREPCCKR
jgi:hypothetical protein